MQAGQVSTKTNATLMKTRVALFGGGFDPPHKGHQLIPIFLLDHKLVDEVWYVPVKLHPFGKQVSPDKDRLAMIEAVVAQLKKTHPQYADNIKINTWELDRPDQTAESYTIRTLDELSQKYPQHTFKFVIGSDNLEKFHLWGDYKRILDEYGVFVYPRVGYFSKALRVGMHFLGDAPLISVSSTQMRQQLQENHPDAGASSELILPAVTKYATAHHLYQKKP